MINNICTHVPARNWRGVAGSYVKRLSKCPYSKKPALPQKLSGCASDTYVYILRACVTSEPSQGSNRRVLSFKTHQRYWTTGRWTSQKRSPSNRQHTACSESRKYISEDNQNAQNDESRAQPLIHVYIFFVILWIFKDSFYIFFETTWNYLNHATQWH